MGCPPGLVEKAFAGDSCAGLVEKAGGGGFDALRAGRARGCRPAVFGLHAVRCDPQRGAAAVEEVCERVSLRPR